MVRSSFTIDQYSLECEESVAFNLDMSRPFPANLSASGFSEAGASTLDSFCICTMQINASDLTGKQLQRDLLDMKPKAIVGLSG